MDHHAVAPLIRYPPSNNSLLSSGNPKKAPAYEPRTEAISPVLNDDIISTKDEQALLVEKLKKVEAEILQTDLQIGRLRKQKAQLEQENSASKEDGDQENVCDTKQLSIAKLVYHENRSKAQKAHAKFISKELPLYNQPSDNAVYHHNATKFANFKTHLISCISTRFQNRLKLEETVSTEYDRRMEKWLKSIETEDSQPNKRINDAKTREFFEKQFPELKKARESVERFSRVGQRVARSDAELDEIMDGINEREDLDKKVKSYAVIPPMLEEMRSRKPKYINMNGYVDDIIAEYKEYQILNTWTDEEKEIFRESYLQNPKNFGLIASMTSRKNVANCVQYYYLSKKNENYKQLLKRQQKRRTRSFVRPAQQTPAITTDNTVTEDVTTDVIKDSAFKQEGNATCCICGSEFSQTNQFRNVTRSNHHLYGIGVDSLEPGMRICYSCRFRHVRHPSFDEPVEEEMDEEPTPMEVEPSLLMPINTTDQAQPPPAEPVPTETTEPNCETNGDTNKNRPRRTVRDIIYQAIEMSFEKPKTTEPQEVTVKTEQQPPPPVQQPPIMTPLSVQHPNIVPLEHLPPQPSQPQTNPLTPHIPMSPNIGGMDPNQYIQIQQQLQMEYNIRQQQILSQQLQQQQLQRQQQIQRQQHQQQQHQQQLARQQQLQREQQIQQQQLHRQQQIISQQLQQQHQLQRQQQQHQHQQQQEREQHLQQMARQQQQPPPPQPQPMPTPQSMPPLQPMPTLQQIPPQPHMIPPLQSMPSLQPLPPPAQSIQQKPIVPPPHQPVAPFRRALTPPRSFPPMAHGVQLSKTMPLENGVLNLSKPAQPQQPILPLVHPQPIQQPLPPQAPPQVIQQIPQQVQQQPQQQVQQSLAPPQQPVRPPVVQQQVDPPKPQVNVKSSPSPPPPEPQQAPQPPMQPSTRSSPSPPPQKPTPVLTNAPRSPNPPTRDEDSRSPMLTGSPTSPREMVIDESADVQSESPATSEQDDTTK